MDVAEAVASRRSVRGFTDQPVDRATVERLVVQAARAPSGGNIQPWHVDIVGGASLDVLKAIMRAELASGARDPMHYAIYPDPMESPYRERRFAVGEAMYGHIGIPRDDRAGRRAWFARNFQFFGAPVALFCSVDRAMGPPQWSDLGMYLQSLMLLLVGEGLASCAQECWAMWPDTMAEFLQTPPDRMLFCGLAIGHEDVSDPANRLRTERADAAEWVRSRW
jgi:nitroreductase